MNLFNAKYRALLSIFSVIFNVSFISVFTSTLIFTNGTYATLPTHGYFCINYGHKGGLKSGGLHIERHPVRFVGDFAYLRRTNVLFYGQWLEKATGSNGKTQILPVGLLKGANGDLSTDTAFLTKNVTATRVNLVVPTNGYLVVAPLFQDRAIIRSAGPKHIRGTPYELGQDWLGRGIEVYGLKAEFSYGAYTITNSLIPPPPYALLNNSPGYFQDLARTQAIEAEYSERIGLNFKEERMRAMIVKRFHSGIRTAIDARAAAETRSLVQLVTQISDAEEAAETMMMLLGQ